MLEEFIGSPLLAHKVETSYDVVAQLLNEMCDAGAVSVTEPNALRDLVEVEGWLGKILGGINLSSYVTNLTDCTSMELKVLMFLENLEFLEMGKVLICLAYHLEDQPPRILLLYHGEGLM